MMYEHHSIKAQLASLERISNRLDAARTILLDRFAELSSFLCCMPYPAWIKGKDQRMIYVNRAYENAFGITPEQYNMKMDAEIWTNADARSAEIYQLHDSLVMEQKRPLHLVEPFVDLRGNTVDVDVIKWGSA